MGFSVGQRTDIKQKDVQLSDAPPETGAERSVPAKGFAAPKRWDRLLRASQARIRIRRLDTSGPERASMMPDGPGLIRWLDFTEGGAA